MNLSDVADELYELPPDEFITARDARRKEARTDGNRELAQAIGKLRKPSTAAWVINTLARREPDELRQLVALGAELREAQRDLDGEQLKELTRQRRRVVRALARQARSLAQQLGRPVSDSVAAQVQDTLRAAVADEDAGRAALSGRLTSPLSYSGVGKADVHGAVATLPPGEAAAPTRAKGESDDGRASTQDRRHRAAQEQLAGAREELAEAETAAAQAQSDADRERHRLEGLSTRRDQLRDRIGELEGGLRRAEKESAELTADLRQGQRQRDAAERRAHRASTVRDRARARVERLEKAPTGGDPEG
jgi:DNA repair exonuclease SbcCD ATPase subunit